MRPLAALLPLLLTACAAAPVMGSAPAPYDPNAPLFGGRASASALLRDAAGAGVGRADLFEGAQGVLLRIRMTGLTPGWHGLHLHAKGECTAPFTSAGPHVNHGGGTHGLLNPAGPESGDLPNLYVHADGTGAAELFTPLTRLGNLLDADGSAIVVHALPDDQRTPPIGGSGDRVACGVIGDDATR